MPDLLSLGATVAPYVEDATASLDARALLRDFLTARKPETIRCYLGAIECFQHWYVTYYSGPHDPPHAVSVLIGKRHDFNAQGNAYRMVLAYRGYLVAGPEGRKLAAATVNIRLATLRSLTNLARRCGLIPWSLEVSNIKAEAYRDTRGPGSVVVGEMLAAMPSTKKGCRDAAMVRLLHDVALRRGEVVALDLADFYDFPEGGYLQVLQKGRHDKTRVDLPPVTVEALRAYLRHRGERPGPLFLSTPPFGGEPGRLDGSTVYRVVAAAGKLAGVAGVRPHGLRHSGITAAAKASGGNALAVREFARHANVQTSMRYVDDATGLRETITAAVAAAARRRIL